MGELNQVDVPTVVYTVPIGKRLVLTDVTIHMRALSGSHTPLEIQRNNATVSKIPALRERAGAGGGEVYQRSYLSGIPFNAGDTVGVLGSDNIVAFFELRGFQTDMN